MNRENCKGLLTDEEEKNSFFLPFPNVLDACRLFIFKFLVTSREEFKNGPHLVACCLQINYLATASSVRGWNSTNQSRSHGWMLTF